MTLIDWLIKLIESTFFPYKGKNKKLEVVIDKQLENKKAETYPIFYAATADKYANIVCDVKEARKGVMEDYFFDFCTSYLEYSLLRNIQIQIDQSNFYPDLVYISRDEEFKLIVEIDEPYTLNKENKLIPIHCYMDNHKRDSLLICYGWQIVRFAEEQIVKNPLECIYYLKSIINKDIPTGLSKVMRWDRNDAIGMIENKYRNSYLPKEFIELVSNKSSNYKYRSLPINGCRINETTKEVIITFPHYIDGKKVDFGGLRQCSVKRSLFDKAVVDSNLLDYFDSKEKGINFLYRQILFLPTFRGVFLQGFGVQNQEHFNLSKYDPFKIHISEKFSDFLESLRDINTNKLK